VSEKQNGLHTITVRKGCANGIDYVKILVDGIELPDEDKSQYEMSRTLTGTTSEAGRGVFQMDEDTPALTFRFGDQRTTLGELYVGYTPDQVLKMSMCTAEYVKRLKERILLVRAWVQKQDFDTEETFTI